MPGLAGASTDGVNHLTGCIDAMHLKDRLRAVQTDCRHRLHRLLLRIEGASNGAHSVDVPKQNSSAGKDKLGSISKQGDRYLRSLFTAGALAVIRYAKIHGARHRLAHSVVGPAPHQGRRDRARQQARQDGMGDDCLERTLQGTCRSDGVNEITAGHPDVT
jgi:hypothetical protein